MLGLTVWPFEPNIVDPVREEYGYATDVIRSYDGSEQRVALRRHPTGAIEFGFLLDDVWEAQRANVLLHRKQAQRWAAPLWPYRRRLEADVAAGDVAVTVTTAPLPFSDPAQLGPYALLWRSARAFELVQLNAVYPTYLELLGSAPAAAAWPAGTTWVIPVRVARLEARVEGEWLTGRAFQGRIRFLFEAWGVDNFVPTLSGDLLEVGDQVEPVS